MAVTCCEYVVPIVPAGNVVVVITKAETGDEVRLAPVEIPEQPARNSASTNKIDSTIMPRSLMIISPSLNLDDHLTPTGWEEGLYEFSVLAVRRGENITEVHPKHGRTSLQRTITVVEKNLLLSNHACAADWRIVA